MSGLTKEVTATYGNVSMSVGLSNKDGVMSIKSTIRSKPKNRKEKKEFKRQSYRMKKIAKGLYEITTYCPFDIRLLSKKVRNLERKAVS